MRRLSTNVDIYNTQSKIGFYIVLLKEIMKSGVVWPVEWKLYKIVNLSHISHAWDIKYIDQGVRLQFTLQASVYQINIVFLTNVNMNIYKMDKAIKG